MAPRLELASKTVQASGQVPGYQNVQYSPDDFGAGIGRELRRLGATGSQFAVTLKGLADERRANDAYVNLNAAKDENRQWMLDPSDGILSKTGGNASGSTAQATAVTDDIKRRYLAKIDDPETKEAFTKLWDREAEQSKDQAARHELSQLGAYKAQTEKATVATAMQSAYDFYDDPKAIDKAIEDTRGLIRGNSIGADPTTLALAESEAVSSIHLAVVSRYAQEDPEAGLDYYKAHKDEITGKDHVTATQFLQPAVDQQKANQWKARIMGSGGAVTHDIYSAIEFAESGGDTNAQSSADAHGVMQLIPGTARYVAKRLGMTEIANLDDDGIRKAIKADPNLNRELGRAYYDEQLRNFHGDVEAALVAYNAGPGGAEAFLNHNAGRKPGDRDYAVPGWKGLKSETEGYVKKVLGAYSGGRGAAGQSVSQMTPENWSLKNFQPSDILAPTEGGQWVNSTAALSLDDVATKFYAQFPGMKIKINEDPDPDGNTAGRRRGTSDPKDNPHVKNSQHIHGTAFDVQIQGMNDVQKATFLSLARQAGFKGIGFYGPEGHLHLDMGNERTWGNMPGWARNAMKVPPGKVEGLPEPSFTAAFGGAGGTGQAPGAPGALYAGVQPPAMNAYLEAANQIADPGVRSRVLADLQTEAAAMTAASEQSIAANKQRAWDAVIGGTSSYDLPPELQSMLDPNFMGSLRAYEKGKAEGGVKTDWQTWSQVSLLVGSNPESLLQTDLYTDYRGKLADEQFNQLLGWQRAAAEKAKGDSGAAVLFAGMRSRADIINDTQRTMNWKEDSPEIATLGRKLDEQIQLQSSINGKPLDAIQMQDIVDKLLIQDKNSLFSTWASSQGKAQDATNPSTFIAAQSWDTVQPDDQIMLTNAYQQYYDKVPDQETAVDIYNRAMQVYLGAPATGPDDEVLMLKNAFETRYGRPFSPEEVTEKHGRWLLTFLGLKPTR